MDTNKYQYQYSCIDDTTGSFSSDLVTNSYFLSDGSYFRAKQMQFGYTLPTALLSRVGIDRLRVYVQCANLFTITKYKGLDPELQSSDIMADQV